MTDEAVAAFALDADDVVDEVATAILEADEGGRRMLADHPRQQTYRQRARLALIAALQAEVDGPPPLVAPVDQGGNGTRLWDAQRRG